MIIILQSNVTEEQIQHVLERVKSLGLQAHLSRGTYRTIIGIIGDEEKLQFEPLLAMPGVNEVIPVLPPYKLASREAHPRPSIVDVGGVKIGGEHLALIAGPCAVEGAEQMHRIARAVKQAGAHILRGGAFKPRTSPVLVPGARGGRPEDPPRSRGRQPDAGGDGSDRPAVRGTGRPVRRHVADRRPQHAELRVAEGSGQGPASRCCSNAA